MSEDRYLDERYTIKPEYTGKSTPQHVARFCGEWLGSSDSFAEAYEIALKHRREFKELLGI